jgi:moderate conductance mechanosensitive channel
MVWRRIFDYFKLWSLGFVLILSLHIPFQISGAIAQIPIPSNNAPTINTELIANDGEVCGSLVCAFINIDGMPVLRVAGAALIRRDEITIRQRARSIERVMYEVINAGADQNNNLNSKTLKVEVGTLNNQNVIFTPDLPQFPQRVILTVTDLDARQNETPREDLTNLWQKQIYTSLVRAIDERYSPLRVLPSVLQKLGLSLFASLLIFCFQRLLHVQWESIDQKTPSINNSKVEGIDSHKLELTSKSSKPSLWTFITAFFKAIAEKGKSPNHKIHRIGKLISGIFISCFAKMPRESQIHFNFNFRRILLWGQISLWILTSNIILSKFPDTRSIAAKILGTPLTILGYWIVVGGLVKLSNYVVEFWLNQWAEKERIEAKCNRYALRIPTYLSVYKGFSHIVFYVAIAFLTLTSLEVPIAPVLAGAGILGFAISFGAQSLIRDVISGCLILSTDQFAVGDIVTIRDVTGMVEGLNLYITQLRSPDGELITIPNGSITMVQNLSKDWSRVNFAVDIAHDADLRLALKILKNVAEEMQNDPQWQEIITDPAEILGVDNISQIGTQLRVWIKTLPRKQWEVGREFRYRVKLAFDQAGIEIGAPHHIAYLNSPKVLSGSDVTDLLNKEKVEE